MSKPEASTESEVEKKSFPKSLRIASPDDVKRIEEAIDKVDLTDVQKRLKKAITSIHRVDKGLLFADPDKADIGVLLACLEISDRWRPEIDSEGSLLRDPVGNSDDPNELDRDALRLSAFNVRLSTIKGQVTSAQATAEEELRKLKAQIRKAIRDERRGRLEGNPTVQELDDIADTHPRCEEASNIFAAYRELKELVESTYFSVRSLEERLNNRCKSLTSEWGRRIHER